MLGSQERVGHLELATGDEFVDLAGEGCVTTLRTDAVPGTGQVRKAMSLGDDHPTDLYQVRLSDERGMPAREVP